MTSPARTTFMAGAAGSWRVDRITAVTGATLAPAPRLAIAEGHVTPEGSAWALHGVSGAHRYAERRELDALRAIQAPLGRPEARSAALLPITKSDAWWDLAQDERRAIFEARSSHIAGTMRFLPAIARRLHHARELGEPFDFLTWFEFAPEHAALFDELLGLLRASEEWRYVVREVEVRVSR